jgi:transcriptional regulator with XRE-family HTH domain
MVTTFQERLVSARKASGLTQLGAAKAVGVDRVTWVLWEHGREPRSRVVIAQAAAVLGVHEAWLSMGVGPRKIRK